MIRTRGTVRGLSVAVLVLVLSLALVVRAQPAQAFAPAIPLIPLGFVGGEAAAGAVGVAGAAGVVSGVLIPGAVVAAGAIAVGFAVGGFASFLHDRFFADHPQSGSVPADGWGGLPVPSAIIDASGGQLGGTATIHARPPSYPSQYPDWGLRVTTVDRGLCAGAGPGYGCVKVDLMDVRTVEIGRASVYTVSPTGLGWWGDVQVGGADPTCNPGGEIVSCSKFIRYALAERVVVALVANGGSKFASIGVMSSGAPAVQSYRLVASYSCQDTSGVVVDRVVRSAVFGTPDASPAGFPEAACPDGQHLVSWSLTVEQLTDGGLWIEVANGGSWSAPSGSPLVDPAHPLWTHVGGSPVPDPWRYVNPDGTQWDGQPNPRTGVVPWPAIGYPNGDRYPLPTGTPLPQPGDPQGDPETPTIPDPDPEPSPSPTPTPGVDPPQDPRANPWDPPGPENDGSRCWPSGWGLLNPLEWVLRPIVCAFVPSPEAVTGLRTRVRSLTDTATSVAPASWAVDLVGWARPLGDLDSQSCPDWKFSIGGGTSDVVCGKPFTEAIRGMRPVLLALMLGAAFAPLARSLWYASVPVLRPTPTGRDT